MPRIFDRQHGLRTAPQGYRRVVAEFRPVEQLTTEESQRWDAHEETMATAFATFRDQAEPRRYEDLWLVRQAAYLQLKGLELRNLSFLMLEVELIDDFEQPPLERAKYYAVVFLGSSRQPPLGEPGLTESFNDVIHIQLWSPFVLKRVEVDFKIESLSPVNEQIIIEAALVPAPLTTRTRLDEDDGEIRPIRLNSCTVTALGSALQVTNEIRATRMVNELPYPIINSRVTCMHRVYIDQNNNSGSPCPSDVSDMSEYLREHPLVDIEPPLPVLRENLRPTR